MSDLYSDAEAPWDLLAKHLAGEASASEEQALYTWITTTPDHLSLLTTATRAWERGGSAAEAFSEADVDEAWQRFRVAADLAPAPAPAVAEGRVVPLWPTTRPLFQMAAAVLLLLGVWSLLHTFWPLSRQLETVTVAAGPQRQQTTLPDGSRVWVNRHSTLSYAADFNQAARVVQLQGEAFFEVKKDHGRPFTVLANETKTQVLGTSFNVRAYGAEDSVEVAVVTGRVAFRPVRRVGTGADSVLLTPGQRGVIHRVAPTAAVQKLIVDPNFRAWQREELVFDNQQLAQLAQTLSHYYDTPVTLANPGIGSCRFTGTFVRASLPQVLRVVSLSTNLTVRQSAAGYTLDGPGCH
ncbi:FecR domain-containing protein [Hymenobacter sp. BT664]|uniref:FecR domain-containing protein n=1 Tax=Hymenobacter montanus TaxID=2771359 RepID=A0A927BBM6_9BACT|nr:FecR domain-containing protein [Hymenobacter montanus]MBD2767194.1 FecR domain-containing protein [Hymenobacter montanus]